MSITSRQFEQLSAMGINLWQKKMHKQVDKVTAKSPQVYAKPNLTDLAKQLIFNDILLSLNLSISDVNAQHDHLDVGLFNWYFCANHLSQTTDNSHKTAIGFVDNKLFSPSIETIAASTILKKQLWQTIAGNLL